MPKVQFTGHLQRFLSVPTVEADGATVRAVLDSVCRDNPRLRGYVLDEQGALRKHVTVFVSGRALADRGGLSDAVGPADEVYVLQALSGG
jgi:sulfur-carrier protein